MSDKRIIDSDELLRLIKNNSRKNEGEEGELDYDIFIGFADGTYEGIEVDTSYHILVRNEFLFISQIKEFLEIWEGGNLENEEENATWFISDYFSDGNIYELEDVDRVFKEYIVEGDEFIVVGSHDELFKTMIENPGKSLVVEWSR
ncbi:MULTISPECIES: hypothetical protein [Psychrilyobacter]|uniref:Uncharacterized protein n=1 Tax=Psychrilyobacter piezotolerans TaxID=2293438 RepID=A0ABX9KM42_9FUSO|nr:MULTISPECIES: hypothetical protein [Psychrilyobacter]MCS5420399.1 hypothetical protein [Psychrilyobacter sp. S5]NDI76409.1 hypothetical protein [Psychrilyobacter piezotolerans]RDE66005.1 hypothetical protein DV867_00585 [Psychrilyobacter sp. S5]REI43183.1 hypothetical protein DYH56_00585 [Psychrilyobacter piezotolerans]